MHGIVILALYIAGTLTSIIEAKLLACPVDDTELPHESDCTKFYSCENGKPVEFDCPDGLHFNPELKLCDWPQNAGCIEGISTEPTNSTPEQTNSAPEQTTTSSPNPESTTITPTEPTEPGDEICGNCNLSAKYWADSYNCRKYWKCNNGKRESALCPLGLLFDHKKLICNLVTNVIC